MINMNVSAAPLPSNFRGTPQQLIEAFLDRLKITSDAVTVTVSETEPTDNSPWFKNGTQLWVWDTEAGEYIPLDISASVADQISVGPDEPDPEEFQIWLKTEGNEMIGLFFYAGTEAGWVTSTPVVEVPDNSVSTVKIQNSAVTTSKIANGAVTNAKLASGIALTKLEIGEERAFLRMNEAGGAPVWVANVSLADFAFVASSTLSFEHGLSEAPYKVEAFWICTADDDGYEEGDVVDWHSFWNGTEANMHSLWWNATHVGVTLDATIRGLNRETSSEGVLNPTSWDIRLVITPF